MPWSIDHVGITNGQVPGDGRGILPPTARGPWPLVDGSSALVALPVPGCLNTDDGGGPALHAPVTSTDVTKLECATSVGPTRRRWLHPSRPTP
jgi:hypothetical protein